MIMIELMNGRRGCTANCATCPKPIKTLAGPRDDMDAFVTRLVALCERENEPYIFSPTGNINELFSLVHKHAVTKPEDIVGMASFPETSIETIEKVFDYMVQHFPQSRLTIGVLEKGITISSAHKDSIYAMIDVFTKSALPFLLINLPNNYIAPDVFAQSDKIFWESDSEFFAQVRKRYGIDGRPQEKFNFNADEYVRMFVSESKFAFSKRKSLYISRRVISPIDPPGYDWDLFRKSAKDLVKKLRYELDVSNMLEDVYLSPAPFGLRFWHQSFDSPNPFLWFSYAELNTILDDCEKGLFHINDFFRKIIDHIEAGLHIYFEQHISTTDHESITKIGELRTKFFMKK